MSHSSYIENDIYDEKIEKRCTPINKHQIPTVSSGSKKIIPYIIFILLLSSFIIYVSVENITIKKTDIFNDIKSTIIGSEKNNDFEKTFSLLIYGLLTVIISIAVVYNIDYHDISYAKTFATFSKPKYLSLLFAAAFVKSLFGIIISIFVIMMRNGNPQNHYMILFTIAVLLFLYDLSLEMCGFYKWLAHDEIANCNSPYNEIADIIPSDDIDVQTHNMNIINVSQKGDPFILSFSKLSITFILGCFIFLVLRLFIITGHNLQTHKLGTSNSRFILEIIFIGIFSLIPFYLSSKLKKDSKPFFTIHNIIIGNIIPIVLHLMFEYNGMYSKLT